MESLLIKVFILRVHKYGQLADASRFGVFLLIHQTRSGATVSLSWTYDNPDDWVNGEDVLIDLWRDGFALRNVRVATVHTVKYPVRLQFKGAIG